MHHQRTRYIYDLFFKRKAISKGLRRAFCMQIRRPTELFEYCVKEGLADTGLIAKWKKVGRLRCIGMFFDELRVFHDYLADSGPL